MKRLLIYPLCCFLFAASCKKEEDKEPEPIIVSCKVFENIAFSNTNAFFSTNSDMKIPVDSLEAKSIASSIDLTFFFSFDYTEPGFMDPVTRSKEWSWNDYKKNWLNNATETRFYSTQLNKSDFDAAKADTSILGNHFRAATTFLAPHGIFPTGSCIGGRESSNPVSLKITKEKVFAFKNTASGKRGLIFIRGDQPGGWPLPVTGTITKVDIIKEP